MISRVAPGVFDVPLNTTCSTGAMITCEATIFREINLSLRYVETTVWRAVPFDPLLLTTD